MAETVRVNTVATVRHRLNDLAGTGTVTGKVLGDFTVTLRDPTTSVSVVAVAVGEVGATGYYDFTFTPDTTGTWILTLQDPTGTAEAVTDYQVIATATGAIADVAGNDLTTLARVRERLGKSVGDTAHDTLIQSLITEVSGWVKDFIGRTLPETTWTEYQDGNGEANLWLREGPLVSVASVEDITYEDDGSGGRKETAETIEAYRYVLDNIRSEGAIGIGMLRRVDGGVWTQDARRWKVVYTAGFNPLPDGVVHFVTTWVIHEYANRTDIWVASRDEGADKSINLLTPGQLEREKDRVLGPYRAFVFL